VKLDIGCGLNKHPGFLGIDIEPFAGVDLIWDINKRIPLPDHCIEFIMASRSLCYVDDLFNVLADLYRLCVHKAVICILAPYAHNFNHISNPYLKQRFDESSPRYWTSYFYQPPHGPTSPELTVYAEHKPEFDFRLLQMQFIYGDEFDSSFYDVEELETLQRFQPNMVNEILYFITAVKQPITNSELDFLSRQSFPLPSVIKRDRDNNEGQHSRDEQKS
jgi:SAM-dependent methyltransferase